jgi:hypothetical protein
MPHWSYLKIDAGSATSHQSLFTCVLSERALRHHDLRHLGLQLYSNVRMVTNTRLSFVGQQALCHACALLYEDALCTFDLGFRFGLYRRDVLGLDTQKLQLVQAVIAKRIALAAIHVAEESSKIFANLVR